MKKQIIAIGCLFLLMSSFAQDEDLQNEFLESVKYTAIDDVKEALAKGADINGKTSSGSHAGEYAMWNIDEGDELVVYLLDNGLDPLILNGDDANLLHIAAENEGSIIMKKLVALGCPINAKNGDGSTPLHLAAENSDMEALQTLVDLGADITVLDEDGKSIVEHLEIDNDEQWSLLLTMQLSQDQKDAILYHCIYELESEEKTAAILEKGADPNMKDQDNTPLIIHASDMEETGFLKLLLTKDVDVNAKDEDGYSALWFLYNNEVLNLLIEAGINVNVVAMGETPLTQAIYLANIESVRILLDAGADKQLTADGKNAYQYCQYLLGLENAPWPNYDDPELQKERNKEYKAKIKEIAKLVK